MGSGIEPVGPRLPREGKKRSRPPRAWGCTLGKYDTQSKVETVLKDE